MSWLTQVASNLSTIQRGSCQAQSFLGIFRGVEVYVTKSSGISVLVFGNSGSSATSALAEEILKSVFLGVEAQVSNEKSGGNSLEMGVSSLLGILSVFSALGLFDVEVSSHVFASIVGDSLVKGFLVGELNESHSFGSACVSVS